MRFSVKNLALNFNHSQRLSKVKFSFSVKKQIESLKKEGEVFNVTPRIMNLCEKKLLHVENHPLSILKGRITDSLGHNFKCIDNKPPIVTTTSNFDILNFPADHCSRSPSDTFYINNSQLLRTHTSAHQVQLFKEQLKSFVVFGDVYRRDEIDKFHYPVFHQMEAVNMLGDKSQVKVEDVVHDMKQHIEKIVRDLFGPNTEMRWIDAYFPFTEPSFELQIFYENKWVEMLGCGVVHDFVLQKAGRVQQRGWAAGLGLERFAMKLFKIPDVRLFWSEDPRFLNQFKKGQISEFKEFSKYPVCTKDFSMWVTPEYNPNDLFEIIREIGGDLIEAVEQIDEFVDSKRNRTSKAYRISFRSLERTLTNEEITKIQFQIRDEIGKKLKSVQLR